MPVECPHCKRVFKGDTITSRHKAVCDGWPKAPPPPPCLCGHQATSQTQLKRHRAKCEVWKSRDRKAHQAAQLKKTMLERHGVENPRQLEEAEEKRKATVLERYGAENVFSKGSSVFEKVQASLEGKRPVLRGAENPFAKPEVQEKIREHWIREHGVENPQQVPEIRAKTRETNLERYGGELLGSEELTEKARATNLERYGDEFPQRTEEVKERQQETNLERYGVPWTSMDPEIRAKQLETHHERYGSHWFASEEGKEAIRQACLDKYGVDSWMKTEGAWGKLVEVFRERYGTDHPLQLAEFLEKRIETVQERYGVDHVLQDAEVMARLRATNLERYGFPCALQNEGVKEKGRLTNMENWGVPHPMQNKDYARQHFEKMGPTNGPNGLERAVHALAPEGSLIFTGDFTFWRYLPLLGRNKNPDFIVPGPDPENPRKGVTRVVEAFGDFWHSRMFTGKVPFAHETELIDAYAEVGIECLVVWESEVKRDPEEVRGRLFDFLSIGP
jgi:hypothetical protein